MACGSGREWELPEGRAPGSVILFALCPVPPADAHSKLCGPAGAQRFPFPSALLTPLTSQEDSSSGSFPKGLGCGCSADTIADELLKILIIIPYCLSPSSTPALPQASKAHGCHREMPGRPLAKQRQAFAPLSQSAPKMWQLAGSSGARLGPGGLTPGFPILLSAELCRHFGVQRSLYQEMVGEGFAVSQGSWLENHLRSVHVPDSMGEPDASSPGGKSDRPTPSSLPLSWGPNQLIHHMSPASDLAAARTERNTQLLSGLQRQVPRDARAFAPWRFEERGAGLRGSGPCCRVLWRTGCVPHSRASHGHPG